MEHTKEQWVFGQAGDIIGSNGLGDTVCLMIGDGNEEANARRIVACVNACAGIPTEDLERWGKAGGMAELRNIFCSMNQAAAVVGLTEQRDELLRVMQGIEWCDNHCDDGGVPKNHCPYCGCDEEYGHSDSCALREAIAKAEKNAS